MELGPELSTVGAKASMVDRWNSRVHTSAWIKRRSMYPAKSVGPIQAKASGGVELSDSNHFTWDSVGAGRMHEEECGIFPSEPDRRRCIACNVRWRTWRWQEKTTLVRTKAR